MREGRHEAKEDQEQFSFAGLAWSLRDRESAEENIVRYFGE